MLPRASQGPSTRVARTSTTRFFAMRKWLVRQVGWHRCCQTHGCHQVHGKCADHDGKAHGQRIAKSAQRKTRQNWPSRRWVHSIDRVRKTINFIVVSSTRSMDKAKEIVYNKQKETALSMDVVEALAREDRKSEKELRANALLHLAGFLNGKGAAGASSTFKVYGDQRQYTNTASTASASSQGQQGFRCGSGTKTNPTTYNNNYCKNNGRGAADHTHHPQQQQQQQRAQYADATPLSGECNFCGPEKRAHKATECWNNPSSPAYRGTTANKRK